MIVYIPPRYVSYVALITVILVAVTLLYRKLIGDDIFADILGASAIALGIFVVVYQLYGRQRLYRKVQSDSVVAGRIAKRARKIGLLGGIIVLGSFILLVAMLALFGAHNEIILEIWVVLFLVGWLLMSAPMVVKNGIMLGIIGSIKPDDK